MSFQILIWLFIKKKKQKSKDEQTIVSSVLNQRLQELLSLTTIILYKMNQQKMGASLTIYVRLLTNAPS